MDFLLTHLYVKKVATDICSVATINALFQYLLCMEVYLPNLLSTSSLESSFVHRNQS